MRFVGADQGPLPFFGAGCDKTFALLSVFKWEDRKNPLGLLEAYLREFSAKDGVTLYVRAGKSEASLQQALDALVARLGLVPKDTAKVVWVPQVPHAEYPALFACADAFVLPTHAEGWGASACRFLWCYPFDFGWPGERFFSLTNHSPLVGQQRAAHHGGHGHGPPRHCHELVSREGERGTGARVPCDADRA